MRKTMLLAAAVAVLFAAGCAGPRYHDRSYYGDDGRRYWHDHSRQYDDNRYRDRDDYKRVRVCDADGSDCHWEYRSR